MKISFRRRSTPEPAPAPAPVVDIRVTSPDGVVAQADSTTLFRLWQFGERSNDGWFQLVPGVGFEPPGGARLRVWIRPTGYVEPAEPAKPLVAPSMPPGALVRHW